MNVTVDRESILLLLCDYLEKNGLIATLTALETEADVRPSSPALTAVRGLALGGKWRELEKALLHRHEEENQQHRLFKRAQYSLAKQLYLETVAALDEISPHREPSDGELDEVERCLGRLERLAPSREEYSSLRALSESPTDFFRDWNLQKARKETCGDLLAWCRADCFKGREEKRGNEEKTGEIYQLTLLLVRGKMYEQCEQIIARRCGNAGSGEQSKKKKTSAIQDLPSWLQTRPDSVFQETPRLVQVTEAGENPGANTLSGGVGEGQTLNAQPQAGEEPAIALAKSPHTVPPRTSTATPEVTKFPANSPPKLPTLSKKLGQHQTSPPELAKLSSLTSSPPLAPPALQPNKFTSEPPSEPTTPTLPAKETKTKAKREVKTTRLEQKEGGVSASVEREDGNHREGREGIESSKGRQGGNCSGPRESKSKRDRVTEHRDNVEVATEELRLSLREESTQQPSASCTPPEKAPSSPIPPPDQQTQGLTADNDLRTPAWALQTTPLHRPQQKKDRNSSTPKPSTQHFIISPPTSPVPRQSFAGLQATPSGWSHDRGAPSERKQIDFDGAASQSCVAEELLPTASWPTATLTGRVTDSQVKLYGQHHFSFRRFGGLLNLQTFIYTGFYIFPPQFSYILNYVNNMQAVRSVAFSESGQLVAVGANSKCLRILSTAPLLDNCRSDQPVQLELPLQRTCNKKCAINSFAPQAPLIVFSIWHYTLNTLFGLSFTCFSDH